MNPEMNFAGDSHFTQNQSTLLITSKTIETYNWVLQGSKKKEILLPHKHYMEKITKLGWRTNRHIRLCQVHTNKTEQQLAEIYEAC